MNLNLPFGIDFVVEQDLIPMGMKKYPNAKGYNMDCPFCAAKGYSPDRKHKFSVNIYKNVCHCMRCNTGYGIIDLHAALSSNKLTRKQAREDLMKRWNGLPSDVQVKLLDTKANLEAERAKMLEPAPIEIRDVVYRKFLEQLTLSKAHHDDLISRGLTEDEIVKGKYKTVPAIGFSTFASNALTYEVRQELKKHPKWGIPGFYNIRSDKPLVGRLPNGYFIPVYDEYKHISGMQIRFDKLSDDATEEQKHKYAKYVWFSSANQKASENGFIGCSCEGIENIHYAGDWFHIPKVVNLTEGVLKADVAACLSGRYNGHRPASMLGLVGINNYSQLSFELLKLKQYGLEKVIISVDMDYRTKQQVADSMKAIIEIVDKCGLKYSLFQWDDKYKGIDDYLLYLYKKKFVKEEA